MMPPLYTWLGAGRIAARTGARHNMIVPYGVYGRGGKLRHPERAGVAAFLRNRDG